MTLTIRIFSLFSLLFILFLSSPLFSKENDFYDVHQEYVGLRPMGMGNAFVAVGGDYNTLFYNPAGLADLKEKKTNITLLQLGLTTGKHSMIDLYRELNGASDKEGDNKTTDMADFIQARYGRNYYARVSPLSFIWAGPRKGFAFIPFDLSANLGLHQQVGPTLKLKFNQDSTIAFGYGTRLSSHPHIAIGATAKAMYRYYFGKALPALELATNSKFVKKSDAREGGTFDLDLGMLYNWPYPTEVKPTFGLAVRNALDLGFRKNYHTIDEHSGRPPNLERRIDVGSKIDLNPIWRFQPLIALDVRDIGHSNWNVIKAFSLGTEWKWQYDWWLKGSLLAGLRQGYPTGGFSLEALWFLFELISYGDEVGTKSRRIENRIWMGRLSFYF